MTKCPLTDAERTRVRCAECMWHSTRTEKCIAIEGPAMSLEEYAEHRGVDDAGKDSRDAKGRIATALVTYEYADFIKDKQERFDTDELVDREISKVFAKRPFLVRLGVSRDVLISASLKKHWKEFTQTMPAAEEYDQASVLFVSERLRQLLANSRRKLLIQE